MVGTRTGAPSTGTAAIGSFRASTVRQITSASPLIPDIGQLSSAFRGNPDMPDGTAQDRLCPGTDMAVYTEIQWFPYTGIDTPVYLAFALMNSAMNETAFS